MNTREAIDRAKAVMLQQGIDGSLYSIGMLLDKLHECGESTVADYFSRFIADRCDINKATTIYPFLGLIHMAGPNFNPKEKESMAKRQRKKRGKKPVLQAPVNFGGVSIGDETARIGFKINREHMNLSKADDCLCGRRLTGRIVVTPNGEDPNQQPLPGMEEIHHEVATVFDVKRFSTTRKQISGSAVMQLSAVDVSELGHFAKKQGVLVADIVGDLEDSESDDDEED